MSNNTLAPNGGRQAAPTGGSVGALAAPAGAGAAGAANISMARMIVLLEQARKALLILQDVGADLMREASVTGEMADALTASFGERTSLEEMRVIAGMLLQIAEGSLSLVARGGDAARTALMANFQVLVAQEQLHALGADGAYVDSRRRAG